MGNEMMDQFQPFYFAIAFSFCNMYGTACPDFVNHVNKSTAQPVDRRCGGDAKAPQVNIHMWAAAMARRVEGQFRRDWTFGFTVWNYIFRTMVNLQHNMYMYSVPDADGGRRSMTNQEIMDGMLELQRKLRGNRESNPGHIDGNDVFYH
eukprot:5851465-Amphidinium_carterae.1